MIYSRTDQVKSGNTQGETYMRQITVAAATVAILALAAPASAAIMGGPIKQNGQCWKSHSAGSEATWGHWEACPAPAATPATRRPAHPRT
jgi:hypothetical protein